jgi:hypothetical protein
MATFNTTIHLSEPPDALSQRLALELPARLTGSKVNPQPGLIVVTRTYTPGWAKVLGILGLLLFLIGVLFFLVRKTDTLTIGISPHLDGGSTVVVAGEASPSAITAIQSALTVTPLAAAA